MGFFYSRVGLILSFFYLVIFFLSGILTLYFLIFHTAHSELSGVWPILVTLPWSMLMMPLTNSWGYTAWYGQFAGNPAVYGFLALLPLFFMALLNAVVLYALGKLLEVTVGGFRRWIGKI